VDSTPSAALHWQEQTTLLDRSDRAPAWRECRNPVRADCFAARRFVWQAIVELSGAGGSVAGHAPPALGRDCRCRRRL